MLVSLVWTIKRPLDRSPLHWPLAQILLEGTLWDPGLGMPGKGCVTSVTSCRAAAGQLTGTARGFPTQHLQPRALRCQEGANDGQACTVVTYSGSVAQVFHQHIIL